MEANLQASAHGGTFRPWAPIGRSWRRLRRRPRGMQLRTVLIVVAIVVGLIAWLVLAPAGTPGGGGSAGAAVPVLRASTSSSSSTPVSQASTSDRGVSKTSINVVFPVVAVNSLAGKLGFAEDKEYNEQIPAINLFVDQINQAGGINGRKINPIIVQFDPTNDANMQALCEQWTQGTPAVFAVIDGIGTWTGSNQLCVTQQGHTPLISAWSTISEWTQLGSPYLWWTGPDMAPVLQATVQWGMSSGRLGHGTKVGVAVSDQAADQAALNQYLLPDLKKVGITPVVETIAGNPEETAATSSDSQLAVEKFEAAGVQSVFPLLPANAFFPYIGAETSQKYYPQLLLSDYQSTVEAALGLIPEPYEQAINGQEGVTTETLGGFDDARPESQGGYDPGVRSCYETWHKFHPKPIAGTTSFYIEEQGPIQAWCGAIRLFAEAAKNAGPDLNRRTFVEAMSKITDYPGTLSPVWSFGPNKMYGPTQYQVVKVHNNVPPSSQCKLKTNHQPQGTCWVTLEPFKPLPSS
ncbi:MAG TPA: ABC transporter substrate-binding protein [Acidimicrobiales bacterium]|nr:ABC transporter substrate-binding protein [Acidimicrobiales bacterium]